MLYKGGYLAHLAVVIKIDQSKSLVPWFRTACITEGFGDAILSCGANFYCCSYTIYGFRAATVEGFAQLHLDVH